MVKYHTDNSLPLVPTVKHVNSVHTDPVILIGILILSYSSKWSCSLKFNDQYVFLMCPTCVTCVDHMCPICVTLCANLMSPIYATLCADLMCPICATLCANLMSHIYATLCADLMCPICATLYADLI
jgi:hypothetical protein